MPIMCFVIPTVGPYLFLEETFSNAWYHNILRYVMSLHCTWFVNSAAHIWGMKPYDKYAFYKLFFGKLCVLIKFFIDF